mmetsp:Transcript_19337/g.44831  ORF Transcript_19337/g.44831 Transcript_19337/m.44831 type:complete len:355 (-) Transcript_19337:1754-2818(-)
MLLVGCIRGHYNFLPGAVVSQSSLAQFELKASLATYPGFRRSKVIVSLVNDVPGRVQFYNIELCAKLDRSFRFFRNGFLLGCILVAFAVIVPIDSAAKRSWHVAANNLCLCFGITDDGVTSTAKQLCFLLFHGKGSNVSVQFCVLLGRTNPRFGSLNDKASPPLFPVPDKVKVFVVVAVNFCALDQQLSRQQFLAIRFCILSRFAFTALRLLQRVQSVFQEIFFAIVSTIDSGGDVVLWCRREILLYRCCLLGFLVDFRIRSLSFSAGFPVLVLCLYCVTSCGCLSFLDFCHFGLELRESLCSPALLSFRVYVPEHSPTLHRIQLPSVVHFETYRRQMLASKRLGHYVHSGNEG